MLETKNINQKNFPHLIDVLYMCEVKTEKLELEVEKDIGNCPLQEIALNAHGAPRTI